MNKMVDISNNFNIKLFLENSAFYPASGVDGSHLKALRQQGIENFIHVDYSLPKEEVRLALSTHFVSFGYKLVKFSEVTKSQITPNGFRPIANIPLNDHERDRLDQLVFIRDSFNGVNFTSFAILAEYELDVNEANMKMDKTAKFSILHIGGEACAAFEATYLTNGINPSAVVIIRPAEGYGDNWTLFTNSDFRLYQMLQLNRDIHKLTMPKWLLLQSDGSEEVPKACWHEYEFKEKYNNFDGGCLDLFMHE